MERPDLKHSRGATRKDVTWFLELRTHGIRQVCNPYVETPVSVCLFVTANYLRG